MGGKASSHIPRPSSLPKKKSRIVTGVHGQRGKKKNRLFWILLFLQLWKPRVSENPEVFQKHQRDTSEGAILFREMQKG